MAATGTRNRGEHTPSISVQSAPLQAASTLSLTTKLWRVGIAGAAAAVLVIGGAVAPAQALQPGEWTLETELLLQAPLPSQRAAVDQSTGDTYVVDAFDNSFYKFDSNGTAQYKKGSAGSGSGQFKDPKGIAVDSERNVYVADMGNNRIQKFDRNGNFLTQWGSAGNGAGQFSNPYGIAVDSTNHVYVADSGNARIQKFDSNGNYKVRWGSLGIQDGQMKTPMGVAINSDGNVIVADSLNNRVQVFDEDGDFLSKWGSFGSGVGEFQTPTDLTIDQSDRVYVADYINKRVQKLNLVGTYLGQFTTPSEPRGVAFDTTTGRIYVTSQTGSRAFRPAVTPVFTSSPVATATVGKPYSAKLQASGIPAVSGFAVAAGSLPSGVKLEGSTLAGVPSKVGTFKVTLQADNTVDPSGLKAYNITVGKASTKVSASFTTRNPRVNRTYVYTKVRISAPNTTGLGRNGTVKVYYGSKLKKTVKIYPSDGGALRFKLPKFTKKGKTKVTFKFLGNSQLKSKTYATYVRVR